MVVNVKLSIFDKNSPTGHNKPNIDVIKIIYKKARDGFRFTHMMAGRSNRPEGSFLFYSV